MSYRNTTELHIVFLEIDPLRVVEVLPVPYGLPDTVEQPLRAHPPHP